MDLRLGAGFSAQDQARIDDTVARAVRHLDLANVAFCGGLAIRYDVIAGGGDFPVAPLVNLDIVALTESAIRPSIRDDFYILHHHNQNHGARWSHHFVLLTRGLPEPERLRVNVFVFGHEFFPETVRRLPLGDLLIPVQGAADQMAMLLFDIHRVGDPQQPPLDPKQLDHAGRLLKVVDPDGVDRLWMSDKFQRERSDGLGGPVSAWDAASFFTRIRQDYGDRLMENPFGNVPVPCVGCVPSTQATEYPLDSPSASSAVSASG